MLESSIEPMRLGPRVSRRRVNVPKLPRAGRLRAGGCARNQLLRLKAHPVPVPPPLREREEETQSGRRGPGDCGPALHRIAGVDQALSIPAHKRALNAATGAAAVDMESHIVADLAARHGLPFAVVRVIADPVSRGLPRAALVGMRSDGTTDVGACLRSLVRDPAQLPALVRVAVDTSRAMLQLLRCVQYSGPGPRLFRSRLASPPRGARRRTRRDAGDRAGFRWPSVRRS